jgi:hypothetical protein
VVAWRVFCKCRTRSSEKNGSNSSGADDDVERLALLNLSERSPDFTKATHRSQLGSSERSMNSTNALHQSHGSLLGYSDRSTRGAMSMNRIHNGSGLGGKLSNSTSSMSTGSRYTSPVSVVNDTV